MEPVRHTAAVGGRPVGHARAAGDDLRARGVTLGDAKSILGDAGWR